MRDNGQAIMAGSDSNENVKIAYSQALFGEALTDFSVITYPISKWQYRKCRFYLFRLLQMLFQVFLQYAYLHHHDVGKIQSKYQSQE